LPESGELQPPTPWLVRPCCQCLISLQWSI